MFIAAQEKIISKTNGSLPVAIVTRWVVELCSPESSEVKCIFIQDFFFNKESVPVVISSFPLCLEAVWG